MEVKMRMRKQFEKEFKVKVARAALREDRTFVH
jgi:hypothetical protein